MVITIRIPSAPGHKITSANLESFPYHPIIIRMTCSEFSIDTWYPLFNLMMTTNVRLCPLGPGCHVMPVNSLLCFFTFLSSAITLHGEKEKMFSFCCL